MVVIDNITNDVRKVRDPWEVARRMGKVLDICGDAAAVVVTEVKPIRHLDVTPFNKELHKLYATREKVFGCHTQVRMRDLGRDGFHVSPHCADILDKTYSCAILGIPVPCPTPIWDFSHPMQQRDYEAEYPSAEESRGG